MGSVLSREKDTDGPLRPALSSKVSTIDSDIAKLTPINIKDTTLTTEKKIVKISIIGSANVGKKTLFCQYVFGRLPTVTDKKLDNEKRTIDLNSTPVILNILEMGSMCVSEDMLDPLIYFADAIMLMYAVDDKKSFNIIPLIIAKILNRKKTSQYPICIVANKIDLENREITRKQGIGLADRFHASYFEISATSGQEIDMPFITLATAVMNSNTDGEERKGRKRSSSSLLA